MKVSAFTDIICVCRYFLFKKYLYLQMWCHHISRQGSQFLFCPLAASVWKNLKKFLTQKTPQTQYFRKPENT